MSEPVHQIRKYIPISISAVFNIKTHLSSSQKRDNKEPIAYFDSDSPEPVGSSHIRVTIFWNALRIRVFFEAVLHWRKSSLNEL